MTVQNGDFDTQAPGGPVAQADQWTSTEVYTGEEYAEFNGDPGDPNTTGQETFDDGWLQPLAQELVPDYEGYFVDITPAFFDAAAQPAEDFENEWGSTILADAPAAPAVFDVGGPAVGMTKNPATWALSDLDTLTVDLSPLGGVYVVTFRTADFVDIGAATAAEVAAVIEAQIPENEAIVSTLELVGSRVLVVSRYRGAASTLSFVEPPGNPFLFQLSPSPAGPGFDSSTGPSLVEDMEDHWADSSKDDLWRDAGWEVFQVPAFAPGDLTAATFDGGPQEFDGFEDGWGNSNGLVPDFGTVLIPGGPVFTLVDAFFASAPAVVAPVETLEGVRLDLDLMTVDPAADRVQRNAHNLVLGWRVFFRNEDGRLPEGLQSNTAYLVFNETANDFQVRAVLGGPAVDIVDNGFGSHFIRHDPAAWWTEELLGV